MPPPVRPPEMDENTQMGAIAAAVYFMKLYTYAYATGDLTQWQAMSEPECVFCASVVTNVTNLHAAGGWVDPWQVDIIEATYADPAPGYTHAAIDLVYDTEAIVTHDVDGVAVKEVSAGLLILFGVRWDGEKWMIGEGETP